MNPITQRALDAAQRYTRFTDALTRQFEIAVRDGADDARVRTAAENSARAVGRDYLESEIDVIDIDTRAFGAEGYEAVSDAPPPEPITDHWEATGEHLRKLLAAQVARDIATLGTEIQTAAIRVSLARRAGRSPAAEIARMTVDRTQGPNFRFVDRLGRRYAAHKHIRDQYRLHLVTTRNEGFLYAAAEAGIEEAVVMHPNPQHQFAGEILSLGEEASDHASYYERSDEIFHPSSDAYLGIVE